MRIAILTATDRRAGGVESYVEHVAAALARRGHDVSLWHEHAEPDPAARLALPPGVDRRLLAGAAAEIVARLRAIGPDVLVVQGLDRERLERDLTALGPVVLVAHNYYGTCISGLKAWAQPQRRPCARPFGLACLAHYFPRRCGGLSPMTMARLYAKSHARLGAFRQYAAIVTLSEHMRAEYIRHGFPPDRVHRIAYGPPAPIAPDATDQARSDARTIACVARLRPEKGVDLLLGAAPAVARALGRALRLVVIGDGSERDRLERAARTVSADGAQVTVCFTGWLSPDERDRELSRADVLALPSTWPEPLGLVGLEAAHLGVPAVAFQVGGISDWLVDGETGCLAAADPPSSRALAEALIECLRDEPRRAAMGDRARELARRQSPATHAAALEQLLLEVTGLSARAAS